MASKARKLTPSRSERYLGSYNHGGHGTMNGASSELVESDVWSAIDDATNGDDRSGNVEWASRAPVECKGSFGVYSNRSRRHVGGLSLAFDDSRSNTMSQRIVHQCHHRQLESPRVRRLGMSAPVNVPDWSKIYRVDSVESLHESDDGLEESEVVPPHEYLARSRGLAANSVFEGVGRTLKGRDLSRVRDAVWNETGFDG